MSYDKQKKEDLIKDDPIAGKASAIKNLNQGYGHELGKSPVNTGGSWMSKYAKK